MMFVRSFSLGAHVVAQRDVQGWLGSLGYPVIKKGTRGIVRSLPRGWFNDRYLVEFSSGRRVPVAGRYLRPALVGHGDDAWRRYKANRTGMRLGLFLLSLPTLLGVAKYYLEGGSTAGLVAAMPEAILMALGAVVGRTFELVGVPLGVAVLLAVWLWRKPRS
jgi:hypothetical protein